MQNLVNYARKVEEDMYGQANTRVSSKDPLPLQDDERMQTIVNYARNEEDMYGKYKRYRKSKYIWAIQN